MEWVAVLGICAIVVSLVGLTVLAIVYSTKQHPRERAALFPPSKPVAASPERPAESRQSIHGWLAHIPPSPPAPYSEPPRPASESSGPEDDDALEAKRVLSKQECALFWTLYRQIGADYYIFPQIPLKQFAAKLGDRIPYNLRSMWQDGVMDFALADPFSLGVLAGIELDDSSHRQADAEARDRRKDQLLNTIGIDVLRISSGETWNLKRIQSQLKEMTRGHTTAFLNPQECNIFRALRQARSDLYVFPKVSLRQMIRRMSWLPREMYATLQTETAGFLLVHPRYLGTLLVVESAEAMSLRPEKRELFDKASIPCVVVSDESLEPAQLGEQINLALSK